MLAFKSALHTGTQCHKTTSTASSTHPTGSTQHHAHMPSAFNQLANIHHAVLSKHKHYAYKHIVQPPAATSHPAFPQGNLHPASFSSQPISVSFIQQHNHLSATPTALRTTTTPPAKQLYCTPLIRCVSHTNSSPTHLCNLPSHKHSGRQCPVVQAVVAVLGHLPQQLLDLLCAGGGQ